MRPASRHPFACMLLIALTCGLGIGSRRYASHLPGLVARYAGDTCWALALFLVLGLIQPGAPTGRIAALALSGSLLVEVSQLYHAPWIDAVRRTTLGGLVLGFGFLWSDVACYTVGIGLGMVLEWGLCRVHRWWTNWVTWPL